MIESKIFLPFCFHSWQKQLVAQICLQCHDAISFFKCFQSINKKVSKEKYRWNTINIFCEKGQNTFDIFLKIQIEAFFTKMLIMFHLYFSFEIFLDDPKMDENKNEMLINSQAYVPSLVVLLLVPVCKGHLDKKGRFHNLNPRLILIFLSGNDIKKSELLIQYLESG